MPSPLRESCLSAFSLRLGVFARERLFPAYRASEVGLAVRPYPRYLEMKDPKRIIFSIASLSIVVGGLWWFPAIWYSRLPDPNEFVWFQEQTEVPGWMFSEIPVSDAAEAVLVADDLSSGEFRSSSDDTTVRVFSAKRYVNKKNEIGLFSHTPDRCWTAVGWTIEPASPDHLTLRVHAVDLLLERRVFRHGAQTELVYFGAIVGGKPLPYRLDHYLASGKVRTRKQNADHDATLTRVTQGRLWSWAWDSFIEKTPLAGPQHFIRISTATNAESVGTDDKRLQELLVHWLKPTKYANKEDYPQRSHR